MANYNQLKNPSILASLATNVSLGPVANVHITGGATGQILSTDGTGNMSWIPRNEISFHPFFLASI